MGGRAVLGRYPHAGSRVVPAVIVFICGALAENPGRVGKPLRDDFAGIYSAPRGAYRALCEIDEPTHSIAVDPGRRPCRDESAPMNDHLQVVGQ